MAPRLMCTAVSDVAETPIVR